MFTIGLTLQLFPGLMLAFPCQVLLASVRRPPTTAGLFAVGGQWEAPAVVLCRNNLARAAGGYSAIKWTTGRSTQADAASRPSQPIGDL